MVASKEQIQEKIKEIEGIYKAYLAEILQLLQLQNKIITDFGGVLKQEKIREIKKSIAQL